MRESATAHLETDHRASDLGISCLQSNSFDFLGHDHANETTGAEGSFRSMEPIEGIDG